VRFAGGKEMQSMIAAKVFNNNAVSTVMPDGREAILVGNGIGFHKRPGDRLEEERINKVYYVQSEMQTKFLKMLENVTPEVMAAAEQIVQKAADAGIVLGNQGTISLVDHIGFALERNRAGMALPNLMLNETRLLYPKEYAVGVQALELIERSCGVRLPVDEAGYIALHFVTVSADRNTTYDTLRFVKGVTEIIKECYHCEIDENSLEASRLLTHLKFLAMRIFNHARWEDDAMDSVYHALLELNPRNRVCMARVSAYVKDTFHYELNQQELVYLMIHLTKIV
jgi:beta-glucoside operon transcriptional antiterminator